MTFVNLDNKEKPIIRFDCVYPFRANAIAEKHRKEGYLEVEQSRSKVIKMFNKSVIRAYLVGNFELVKNVPKIICVMKYQSRASSNYITFPVEKTHSEHNYFEIRYSLKTQKPEHCVRFDLKKRKLINVEKPQ